MTKKKLNKYIVEGIYGLVIQRFSYKKISEILNMDEPVVKRIAMGQSYKSLRSNYKNIEELRKEVRRRNSYYHSLASKYKLNKIESLWLSGKGREKIVKETNYSHDLVKKVISKLIVKHGRSRADSVVR